MFSRFEIKTLYVKNKHVLLKLSKLNFKIICCVFSTIIKHEAEGIL